MLSLVRWESGSGLHQAMLACHPALYRYARGLCGDSADADDLVQEAFRRALAARRQPPGENGEEVRRWMFIILRNVWKNDRRRAGREAPVEDSEMSPATSLEATPEDALLRKWLQYEIRDALDSLDVVFREVVVLRDLEGLSYAEIAEVVDRPVGTVMSRIARGRKQLRASLAARGARQEKERRA